MKSRLIKICGKIATPPVVVNLTNSIAVLVLVNTGDKFKKFCYTQSTFQATENERQALSNTMFSDIAVSGVGDEVEVFVSMDKQGGPTSSIQNFNNITRKLGRFY